MSLEVVKPGFLSLLQDYGRYGYQSLGVTQGGPLDQHAFLWANYLLDNHYNAAQIEINLGGFVGRFTRDTMIAICGADLSASLNDQPLVPWRSYSVSKGDHIAFVSPKTGLRSYLAVKGGFVVDNHLSSCSTVIREKLGGLGCSGDKLNKNDSVPYTTSAQTPARWVPDHYIPQYSESINLRIIPNSSDTGAGADVIDEFTRQVYEVTRQSDRMGFRLAGEPLSLKKTGIISQGVALGAIQIPKDGQPIILLQDRQTMGGYPLVGCVCTLDIPLLTQSKPGTKISFTLADLAEAESELIAYKKFFNVPF